MAAGEMVLANTVENNISKYSERDYTQALLASSKNRRRQIADDKLPTKS